MPDRSELERCRRLVGELSHAQQWQLGLVELQRYAEQVAACFEQIETVDDELLRRTIDNYHQDHMLVEALRGADPRASAERWTEWSTIVLRILAQRFGGQQLRGDPSAHLSDVQQDALLDLWRGLRTFRYQSRFHTWATTIVVNCAVRRLRSGSAQKRDAKLTQPIDTAASVVDSLPDEQAILPEQAALSAELSAIVRQVLEAQPDERLRVVFELWVVDRQSMRAIGERLHLSPARIHALFHQAIDLIRQRLYADGWLDPNGGGEQYRQVSDQSSAEPTDNLSSRSSHDTPS